MGVELGLGQTSESQEKYTPSVNDPKRQKEMVDRYQKAKEVVGEKMAQDLIQQLASGDKTVNHEQFKHDMLTNPKFMQTILQEWWKLNKEVNDLVVESGFAQSFLDKNMKVINEGLQEFKNSNLLPKDSEIYAIRSSLGNEGCQFIATTLAKSEHEKNHEVKISLRPDGGIWMKYDIAETGVFWRL